MNLAKLFTRRTGLVIRVRGTDENPLFCAKDICDALQIKCHQRKIASVDADEKLMCAIRTGGQMRQVMFLTEPGAYTVLMTCQRSKIPGTAAFRFRRWVTHEVLPSIRRTQRFELKARLDQHTHQEKGCRLWNVVKSFDTWNFNTRRKYFGRLCAATRTLCYLDAYGSPHVSTHNLPQARLVIQQTIAAAIVTDLPAGQQLITDFLVGES